MTLPIDAILSISDPNARAQYLRVHTSMLVREQKLTCRACDLRNYCRQPTPHAGIPPSALAIISPYPSPWDEVSGLPLSSPEEQDLLSTLIPEHAGIPLSACTISHVISCKPSIVPTQTHVSSCRAHLDADLSLASPRVVLLLGDSAKLLFPTIQFDHGKVYEDPTTSRSYVSAHHPVEAARNRKIREEFKSELDLVGLLLRHAFVLRALEVFRHDQYWPSLIDAQISGLDPRLQERHRLAFIRDVVHSRDTGEANTLGPVQFDISQIKLF